jgi:hypothetical protein
MLHGICKPNCWRAGVMKMHDFQFFSQEKQLSLLYQQGIYIGKRKNDEFVRLLFQLDSFYVEITYITYRKSIHKIRYSDSTSILDPYLEQIQVEYLVT